MKHYFYLLLVGSLSLMSFKIEPLPAPSTPTTSSYTLHPKQGKVRKFKKKRKRRVRKRAVTWGRVIRILSDIALITIVIQNIISFFFFESLTLLFLNGVNIPLFLTIYVNIFLASSYLLALTMLVGGLLLLIAPKGRDNAFQNPVLLIFKILIAILSMWLIFTLGFHFF